LYINNQLCHEQQTMLAAANSIFIVILGAELID
jgi:hypothetical protein